MGNGLVGFAATIISAGVFIAIGLYVVVTIKGSVSGGGADFNTTLDNTVGAGKSISTWFSIFVVAGMGALALGFFGGKKMGLF